MTFGRDLANHCGAPARGRISYRALQRPFGLDDAYLDDCESRTDRGETARRDETAAFRLGAQGAPRHSHYRPGRAPRAPCQLSRPRRSVYPRGPRVPRPNARQLTVAVCDLADSTRSPGNLIPKTSARSSHYQPPASRDPALCRACGQYLGDGLLVYFGYPRRMKMTRSAPCALPGILEA